MRAATQPGFAVGVKLNSADFQRGGFSEEESLEVVRLLGEEAVDLIEVSGGTYERAAMWEGTPQRESTRKREAYFLDFAERARQATAAPLIAAATALCGDTSSSPFTSARCPPNCK